MKKIRYSSNYWIWYKEKLIKYCQGIQMGSPIDSNSIPEPWDMPGYTDQVIMAAGAFTQALQ